MPPRSEAYMHPMEVIPVHDVGPEFPIETLDLELARAHALLDGATQAVPTSLLRVLDAVSRRWLAKQDSVHLREIDIISARLGRPGAYFLSVNYEWGCTCRVGPSPDGSSARLVRVLDWVTHGLGRHVIAARVAGAAGPFVTLTWPGYTGILQAIAPGRFSAALNQAPMQPRVGHFQIDWAINRHRVWRMQHITAAHLLREVFETAPSFAAAKKMLAERPISAPAIFSLAGLKPSETVVIERTETQAHLHEGANAVANHWQAPGWRGHTRGIDSAGRACQMHSVPTDFDPSFSWLTRPILNWNTRLAMVADAAEGKLVARGYEVQGRTAAPATAPLALSA